MGKTHFLTSYSMERLASRALFTHPFNLLIHHKSSVFSTTAVSETVPEREIGLARPKLPIVLSAC